MALTKYEDFANQRSAILFLRKKESDPEATNVQMVFVQARQGIGVRRGAGKWRVQWREREYLQGRSNPQIYKPPIGKFIPVSAARINRNGTVTIKASAATAKKLSMGNPHGYRRKQVSTPNYELRTGSGQFVSGHRTKSAAIKAAKTYVAKYKHDIWIHGLKSGPVAMHAIS